MPLPSPKLDDRRFADLMADALAMVDATCPEWTDRNPGDPGITLLESFAFLTEAMIYRLNRVPAKLHVALLNLAGAQLRPPAAAATTLVFSRTGSDAAAITIPAGTRVGTGDGSVEFVVTRAVELAKGAATVEASALQCTLADAEHLGISTGGPGQQFKVKQAPIIAPSGDGMDLIVGVETAKGEDVAPLTTRGIGDKVYAVWREVENFADAGEGERVYQADRAAGVIQFGSLATGAAPAIGREIRAWYRHGGGRAGNVAPDTLKTLKGFTAPLNATNPNRAAGGADGETVDQGIARGPLALGSMRCAVTARDFERVALSIGGVARAKAYAQAQAWCHAEPGVVEILLIPELDVAALPDGAVTATAVIDHRRKELLTRASQAVEARRPLTTRTSLAWAKVRPVGVEGRVVIGPEADAGLVERAVRGRINALLSPLRDRPFGQQLRASDIYEVILAEPGVRYADRLKFRIGEAPGKDVSDLVRDPHQPQGWFAVTATTVNRSLDDGDSWARIYVKEGEAPRFLRRHPTRPGLTLLAVDRAGSGAIHISNDSGETWRTDAAVFGCEVFDAAWIERGGEPLLLLATAEGLRQYAPDGAAGPAPVIVDKAVDGKGFYAVTATTSPSGVISVATAARAEGGVFISAAGGVSETFRAVGLKGKDIRTLATQTYNARDYLWASASAEALQQGEGAFRVELRASGVDDPDGFKPFNIGWTGGSCEGLAFVDSWVFAGSNRGGVLAMDFADKTQSWRPAALDAGLPIRDTERLLHVVAAVAAGSRVNGPPRVFAGGPLGVFRSSDGARTFQLSSATVFTDRIPLPPNWLYCAGEHAIDVVDESEARN